jgi:hypothetical protein
MAGYTATAFHHPTRTCYFYYKTVDQIGVDISNPTNYDNSIFWDTSCNGGTYVPSCNTKVASGQDGRILGSSQYWMTNYDLPLAECVKKCEADSRCYSTGINTYDKTRQCVLYANTVPYFQSISPAVGTVNNDYIVMSDLACSDPY